MIRKLNNQNLHDINGGLVVRKKIKSPEGNNFYYYVHKDEDFSTNPYTYDQDRALGVYYDLHEAQGVAQKTGNSAILIDLAPEEERVESTGYQIL